LKFRQQLKLQNWESEVYGDIGYKSDPSMKTEVQDTEMYYGLEKDNEVEYESDKKLGKD